MTRRQSFEPRWTARDRSGLGIAALYFVLCMIFAFMPFPLLGSAEGGTPLNGALSKAIEDVRAVPYIGRVDRYLQAQGATTSEIAEKERFLIRAYFALLGGYPAATIFYLVVLVMLGIGKDPVTSVFPVFKGGSLAMLGGVISVFLALDGLVAWIGLDGVSAFKGEVRFVRTFDYTPQYNAFIIENVAMMSLSLFATLLALRFIVGFLYVSVGGKVS